MSFSTTYWAMVNTSDGTVTGTGQTTADTPAVPTGALVVSADNHATIVAAEADGLQCKLISGVVRLMKLPAPPVVDLNQIRESAYVVIDTEAEQARSSFLTLGSGQILEYQQTAEEAQRLADLLGLSSSAVIGSISVRTVAPRAGTAGVAPAGPLAVSVPAAPAVIDPALYPMLVAEQQALASIGVICGLDQVALSVLAIMAQWSLAGAAIKRIRREAKLQVSVATTSDAISAVLTALSYPQAATVTA